MAVIGLRFQAVSSAPEVIPVKNHYAQSLREGRGSSAGGSAAAPGKGGIARERRAGGDRGTECGCVEGGEFGRAREVVHMEKREEVRRAAEWRVRALRGWGAWARASGVVEAELDLLDLAEDGVGEDSLGVAEGEVAEEVGR